MSTSLATPVGDGVRSCLPDDAQRTPPLHRPEAAAPPAVGFKEAAATPPKPGLLAGRSWRLRRGIAQAANLRTEAANVARVLGGTVHGPDPLLDHAAAFVGLRPDAVASLRIDLRGRPIGLLLPTPRTWRNAILCRHLTSLKVRAAAVGHKVHIVPPATVMRMPRVAAARRILQTARPASDEDRRTVIGTIEDAGGHTSLGACYEALTGPAAERRIFGLVAAGVIGISTGRPLDAGSRVWIRRMRATEAGDAQA